MSRIGDISDYILTNPKYDIGPDGKMLHPENKKEIIKWIQDKYKNVNPPIPDSRAHTYFHHACERIKNQRIKAAMAAQKVGTQPTTIAPVVQPTTEPPPAEKVEEIKSNLTSLKDLSKKPEVPAGKIESQPAGTGPQPQTATPPKKEEEKKKEPAHTGSSHKK